jgi:[1-hydroxy-2-(trimethylamino)ethyl]phosphonate dioxygenase
MHITNQIFELFRTRGHDAYFGEGVSQQEHALQAAALAEQSKASPALVVAALLHDIGHLIHGLPEDIAGKGVDGYHEAAGADWLDGYFGPEVTEPIRLHVDAKRYLCYSDPGYSARLSSASIESLALQGGPCTVPEARAFEANPYFEAAILLRQWDDAAKVPGLGVPNVEHYRNLIQLLTLGKC